MLMIITFFYLVDFTFWLQSRLIRIYAAANYQPHHKKTMAVHDTILQVILDTSTEAFAEMVARLLQLLAG